MLKRRILLLLFSAALVFSIGVSSINAQWQQLTYNLIGTGPYSNSGAITFTDGILWAGLYDLYKSTDSGVTWQRVSTPNPSGSVYHGISFYDKNTGAICTDQGLYITHDQGQTWQSFFTSELFFQAAFVGSPDILVAGSTSVRFTTDGGVTWNKQVLGKVTKDFFVEGPGQVVAFVETATKSIVEYTSDYGVTWTARTGVLDADSHNFGMSGCSPQIIYGINEENGNYTNAGIDNSEAEIFQSKDGGASFTSIIQYGLGALSAAVAITPGAVYIPKRAEGILQSLDSGATWTLVPGPNVPYDSHDLIAINDTVLFAADVDGSIWRNMHGVPAPFGAAGSIRTLQVTAQYNLDTLAPCVVANASVYFNYFSCSHRTATLDSASLTGSTDFSLSNTQQLPRTLGTFDSLQIGYVGSGSTQDTAYLHLTYNADGANHDTTLLIVSEKFTVYSANSYADGTLMVLPNSTERVTVSEKLPTSVHAAGLHVKTIRYSLSYKNTVLDISASLAASLITPPLGWAVSSAIVQSGVITITLTDTSGVPIQDSLYLGTVSFSTSGAPGSTLVLLKAITIRTDSTAIAFCLASEGDYVANVVIGSAGVALKNASEEIQLSLYPNPLRKGDNLHLEWTASAPIEPNFDFFDVLGAPLDHYRFEKGLSGTYNFTIPAHLAAGIYYVRVATLGQITTRKISIVE